MRSRGVDMIAGPPDSEVATLASVEKNEWVNARLELLSWRVV